MLDCVSSKDSMKTEDGTDVRNYGGLDGIPEAKKGCLLKCLGVKPEEIIVAGNSSLNLMYDAVAKSNAIWHFFRNFALEQTG